MNIDSSNVIAVSTIPYKKYGKKRKNKGKKKKTKIYRKVR